METVSPLHLSMLLTFGLFTLWGAQILHDLLDQVGYPIPTILIVTTAALIFAQVPQINRLKGTRLLGMFAIYLFLAVIGAHCDLGALQRLGQIGPTLVWFVTIVIVVHGLVTYGTGALTRTDVAVVSVASQANIGGGTTALALARTLGRHDLVLPGILVGAVGTAIGTYLGFLTARYLL